MSSRKKVSDKDKERLNNDDVPSVTLRGALKAFKAGDVKEADRRWSLVKDAAKESGEWDPKKGRPQ